MIIMKMFPMIVESLFTSIPVAETIEYILNRVYTNKELKSLCKKSIFKKLPNESVFSANNRLIKQIGGCSMGGVPYPWFSQTFTCAKWKRA